MKSARVRKMTTKKVIMIPAAAARPKIRIGTTLEVNKEQNPIAVVAEVRKVAKPILRKVDWMASPFDLPDLTSVIYFEVM